MHEDMKLGMWGGAGKRCGGTANVHEGVKMGKGNDGKHASIHEGMEGGHACMNEMRVRCTST